MRQSWHDPAMHIERRLISEGLWMATSPDDPGLNVVARSAATLEREIRAARLTLAKARRGEVGEGELNG